MLTNPVSSTLLIVLSGFLLSLLSLFVTDPYCRNVEAAKLAEVGKQQTDRVVQDLHDKLAAVAEAGKMFSQPSDLDENQIAEAGSQSLDALLQIPGVFTVELSREVPSSRRPKKRKRNTTASKGDTSSESKLSTSQPSKVMHRGQFPMAYQVVAIKSNGRDMQKFVGSERQYQIVRMVYQNGGTIISRPHEFYRGDGPRTAIGTTLGPPDTSPIGLLVVTFDELIPPQLLKSELVSMSATDLNLSNQAIRLEATDRVITSDDRSYVSQAKVGERVFRFVVSEASGAGFYPHWIKWASFLLCNGAACLMGLTWLQRGRIELMQRNQDLEVEIERRVALQKHLQATIDFREHERELIAHEIHDGFVQDIIGAQMFAESSLSQTDQDSPVRQKTKAIAELLQNAITEARKTIDYLKPRVVDEVGLVAALHGSIEYDIENYNFHTELHCEDGLPRFPILVERMLYRIIRESVSNSRQHSGCNEATVRLFVDTEHIVAEISDDGFGFDQKRVRSDSFGLPGIRQRIEMLNGRMELESSRHGTKVLVEVPRNFEPPTMPPNGSLSLHV